MENSWRMNWLKQQNIFILLLALIPFIVLLYMTCVYSVDMPRRDELSVAGLIDKYYQGALTWYDLFKQHNEHRMFFPRLIKLSTAIWSKWDVRYWIACNVICGLGIFIALFWQILSTARAIRNDLIFWVLPLISVLVFSLRQYWNWLMGFQIIVYMNVFCTTVSILILSRLRLSPIAFAVAVSLAFVSSFSFASGMFIWPIGFLVLWFSQTEKRSKKIYLIIWILMSVSAALLYFYDYQKPSHHSSLFFALKDPIAFFDFVFSFLASPLIETKSFLAPAAGLAGTLVLVYAAAHLWRSSKDGSALVLPYLALGLYSFLNAVVIAVGRVGWGVQEAFEPRYVTHTFFFWIALAVILFLFFADLRGRAGHAKQNILMSASMYITIGLTLWSVSASFRSIPCFFENYIYGVRLRAEFQSFREEDFAPGGASWTYHRAFTAMRKYKLAAFRDR